MITLGFLSDYLCETIEEYKDKVLKNQYFFDTFKSEENLDKIIYYVRDFLIKEFNKDLDEIERDFVILGKYHGKIGIPFETIFHSLIFIKDALYKKILESEKYLLLAPDLSLFFDKAINAHARGYILKILEIHIKDIRKITKRQKTKYEKIHFYWLIKFLNYIRGKEKTYPAIEVNQCLLNEFLNSFDFYIKSRDKDLLKEIHFIHEQVHMYAKSLIFYIQDKEYVEAYFAYNNLINASYKLLNYLNSIYTHFERDKKNLFLETVVNESKKRKINLTIINILNLRTINKFYGEETGDKVINIVDKKLDEILDYRKFSYIKGYSGEFYILHKEEPEKKYRFAEKIKKALEEITVRGNTDLKFGVALSVLEIKDVKDKNDLLKLMEYSIEKAKGSISKISIFDEQQSKYVLQKEINKTSQIIQSVEEAFSKGNIQLYFQPIYDLKTGKVPFYEVLSRLKKGNQLITAEDFINLIYNMKLIKKFDFEVIKKIENKIPELKRIKEDITIFVNISPASLSSSDFVKYLISVVEHARKQKVNIIVELTEQSLLENYELLQFLKNEYEFLFAIDDFGAGYSSIKVVQDLSILGIIDYLKIDGTLIKDMINSVERKRLVELIVNFARLHGLKTIGEFVENEDTANLLKEIGVDYGQGFYFGKPKTLKDITKELNEKLTRTV